MSQQINKSDRPIIVLCFVCILVCSYMLTDIQFFFGSTQSSESVSIGNITLVASDVRHKSKSDYFWKDTNLKSKISKGDSIFTGSNSSSEVTLNDGKLLKISQNSLVHFSMNKDQLQVDLAFGNISASGLDKSLIITDCGQKYTIDAAKASFELSKTNKCGSFDIQVKTGTVKVNTQKVTKSLPKSKARKISLADTFESVPLPKLQVPVVPVLEIPVVAEVLPEPVKTALPTPQFLQKNREVSLKENTKVKFSWKPVPKAAKYFLEISSNPKFRNSTVVETTQTSFESKPAQAGLSYFRMQAVAPDFLNSEYSEVKIVKTTIPPILVDRLKIQDSYSARSPADVGSAKKFPVAWNSIPTAKSYSVEVSENPDFTSSLSSSVAEPESQLEVPQTGNYYYRIAALDKTGRKISSMPAIGEIVYKKISQIGGPLIGSASKRLSFYFQKEYGQFIWLRWKENLPTSNYRLEISRTSNFEKINFSFATADTKYLIRSKIPEGEYFWRVRSETLTSTLQPSAWSEVATLKIQTK